MKSMKNIIIFYKTVLFRRKKKEASPQLSKLKQFSMRINNRLVKWGNINYALRKSARTYSSRFSILFSLFFLVFSFLISTACLSFPYRIFSRPKEKWEKFELSRLKRIVISLIPLFDNLDVILVKKNHRLIFINRQSCFVSIFFLLFFPPPTLPSFNRG